MTYSHNFTGMHSYLPDMLRSGTALSLVTPGPERPDVKAPSPRRDLTSL